MCTRFPGDRIELGLHLRDPRELNLRLGFEPRDAACQEFDPLEQFIVLQAGDVDSFRRAAAIGRAAFMSGPPIDRAAPRRVTAFEAGVVAIHIGGGIQTAIRSAPSPLG